MQKMHVIELKKGQEVISALHEYLMEKQWKSAIFYTALGSLKDVLVSNPVSETVPPELRFTEINDLCEVVSFVGEISRKSDNPNQVLPCVIANSPSDYVVHCHMACSHGDGQVFGGGLRRATILRALNIYAIVEE